MRWLRGRRSRIFNCTKLRLIGIGSCSYKFHRLFPLSQYDLPTHHPGILAFPGAGRSLAPSQSEMHSPEKKTIRRESSSLTPEQISRNPDVDYTRYVVGICIVIFAQAEGEWSKTRFNFPRILGCWTPNAGGSVSVLGGHVCWLNICCGFARNGSLPTTCELLQFWVTVSSHRSPRSNRIL